jgi:hypothetical protein
MSNYARIILSAGLIIALSGFNCIVVFGKTTSPDKTYTKAPTLAYTIKGLNHNLAIQNFYIGKKNVYITQRYGATTYLSRCAIDGKEAKYRDEMKLTNCGHGQALDIYCYNGDYYFYVGSKANPENSYYFSRQIARVSYSAGKTYNYTDLSRFTYMNYADAAGSRLGTTYRVAAGGNSYYTIFRVQSTGGAIRYSIYDTARLNKLLNSNKMVRMDSMSARKACITSFEQKFSDLTADYLNGSFQGIDMFGKTSIYVTGGGEGQTPRIALMDNAGNCKTLINISGVGKHEIEGLQTKSGKVYFVIIPDTTSKKNTQRIYYFSKSAFD